MILKDNAEEKLAARVRWMIPHQSFNKNKDTNVTNRSFKPWDVTWSLPLCEKPCRTGYTVASDFHQRWAPPHRLALQHLYRRRQYRRRYRRKGFPLRWPPFAGSGAGWRACRRGARPTVQITTMLKQWFQCGSGSSYLALWSRTGSQTIADPCGAQLTRQSRGNHYEIVYNSGVNPHWFHCGFGSSFSAQCGSGSRGQTNADPDPDTDQRSQKVKFYMKNILKAPVVRNRST